MRNLTGFFLVVALLVGFSSFLYAGETRRTHQYIRSIAMGDAFTAVADSKETIAYNPAGLLQKNVEWTLHMPLLGFGFNEIVKDWNNQETEYDFSDTATLENLEGERVFLDTQVSFMPALFIPNKGIYTGFDADAWVEIVFPPQVSIPTVYLEIIGQGVFEYAMAFELFGLFVGTNFKGIYRQGIASDVDLISVASYLNNEDYNSIIEEYAEDQPEPKLALDFGLLYRFDHPWHPRIGISFLDAVSMDMGGQGDITVGGIDYKDAGEVKALNTIGFALTKTINDFDLTWSMDYRDFTFSYFNHSSSTRRIAIGFETAYDRGSDNSHLMAFQLGLKELKYFSYGLKYKLGVLEFNTVRWTENFGTDETELLDTRYMFLLSLVF